MTQYAETLDARHAKAFLSGLALGKGKCEVLATPTPALSRKSEPQEVLPEVRKTYEVQDER